MADYNEDEFKTHSKMKITFKRGAEGIVTIPERKKTKIPDLPTAAVKTEMEELTINDKGDKPKEPEESKPEELVAVKYRTLALASTIKVVKEVDGKEKYVEVTLYDLTNDYMDLTDNKKEEAAIRRSS